MSTKRCYVYAAPLSIFAALFAWGAIFAPLEVDPHHDGISLKAALDVAHGAVPFRDTFTQYGLLMVLIQALSLKVFGSTLLVLRYTAVVAYAAAGAGFFVAWRNLLPGWAALVAVLAWMALAPFYMLPFLAWSSVYCLVFQAVLLVCLFRHYKRESFRTPWWALGAGVSAGAMAWIRIPVGVVHLVAIVCLAVALEFVFRERSLQGAKRAARTIAFELLGFALLSLVLLAFLVMTGGFTDWYLQSIKMAAVFGKNLSYYWYGDRGLGAIGIVLRSLLVTSLGKTWLLLPLATLALGVAVLVRFFRLRDLSAADRLALALVAVGLASWAQYYPVTEQRHVFWAAPPMVAALILISARLFGGGGWSPRVVSVCILLTLTAALGSEVRSRVASASEKLRVNTVEIARPPVLRGIKAAAEEVRLYEEVHKVLSDLNRAYPAAPIITTGYDSLYLTFVPQRNWHPLYVFFDVGVAVYPDFPGKLDRLLRVSRPIMITPGNVPHNYGYEEVARFRNGISIVAPTTEAAATLLHARPRSQVLQHVSISLPSIFRNPMQVTGHRFPAVDFNKAELSIELVVRPQPDEEPSATILANVFGPEHGRGLAIQRGRRDEKFHFFVGSSLGADARTPTDLLTFAIPSGEVSYVVVTRARGVWRVWVNGRMQASGVHAEQIGGQDNTVFLGNGLSRTYYFKGLIFEYRALAVALPEEAIIEQASGIQRQFSSLPTLNTSITNDHAAN